MNKLTQIGAISAFCMVSATALGAPITLNNQGFESGLDDWTSIGDVTATSSEPVKVITYDPFSSGTEWNVYAYEKRMAQLITDIADVDGQPISNMTDLDDFFGVTISGLIPEAYNGSGIKQSFSGSAGDVLTQYYNFFSTEDSTSEFEEDGANPMDTAFVSITNEAGTFELFATLADSQSVGLPGTTGWQPFQFVLPEDGDYTIGFGVVNWRDGYFDAQLFVDNNIGDEPVPPVPEPASFALLGLGLAGLGWFRRKRA